MLGERSLRDSVNKAIDSMLMVESDDSRIRVDEVTGCLRRSYYNRRERSIPMKERLILLQRYMHGISRERKEYHIEDLTIIADADTVVDDAVVRFEVVDDLPSAPEPASLIALNASLWILDKDEGALVYITRDGSTIQFSITRDKRLFDETIRRAKVLSMLLKDNRPPVLEPSEHCNECSYYERCYIQHRRYEGTTLERIFGLKRE
ncbi:MAG: Dna2/Cas4 domain-containing protein [Candidatus Nitrosocaldus sp.]|nr:Dna2/Cas4 domain-containing protein [Candidatus Nitrosocaldus sp.]MCS7140914.1 Dna2/Cas4 domain-containing protein [Candidatus Nitrosocaldus sp.]MDW7999842.1 Dna2/Cas4 domain-containing protein [Candidatus Nitrosocaldus sp.]MDW8274796.1 Dna2/Cas4 domain-containing protein [Candidatus Nitrosocaldus sp.]